jgi:hypothetical protein
MCFFHILSVHQRNNLHVADVSSSQCYAANRLTPADYRTVSAIGTATAAATSAIVNTGGPKEAVASGLRSQDDASYANDTLALQFFKGASPQQQQVPVMLNCQAKVCVLLLYTDVY